MKKSSEKSMERKIRKVYGEKRERMYEKKMMENVVEIQAFVLYNTR